MEIQALKKKKKEMTKLRQMYKSAYLHDANMEYK